MRIAFALVLFMFGSNLTASTIKQKKKQKNWSIKSNSLEWIYENPNLTLEKKVGNHASVGITGKKLNTLIEMGAMKQPTDGFEFDLGLNLYLSGFSRNTPYLTGLLSKIVK